MILSRVKKDIDDLRQSDVGFYEYFTDYVVKVNEFTVNSEVDYMRLHNTMNPMRLNTEINSCIEELKNI